MHNGNLFPDTDKTPNLLHLSIQEKYPPIYFLLPLEDYWLPYKCNQYYIPMCR